MSWSRSYPGVLGARGSLGELLACRHGPRQMAPGTRSTRSMNSHKVLPATPVQPSPCNARKFPLRCPAEHACPNVPPPLTSRRKSRRKGENCLGLRLRSLLLSPPVGAQRPEWPSGLLCVEHAPRASGTDRARRLRTADAAGLQASACPRREAAGMGRRGGGRRASHAPAQCRSSSCSSGRGAEGSATKRSLSNSRTSSSSSRSAAAGAAAAASVTAVAAACALPSVTDPSGSAARPRVATVPRGKSHREKEI
jgi:hypothetical protein